MQIHFSWKNKKLMAVLTVTVSVMVTLPVLFVPVGLRSGAPAYILVDRAYAAAYPVDPNKETVLVEQWALTGAAINGLEDNTADTTDASAAATPADGATATPAETAAATPADTPAADSSGRIVIGAGQTVAATYIEGAVPADSAADQYADILTATIVQHVLRIDRCARNFNVLSCQTLLPPV